MNNIFTDYPPPSPPRIWVRKIWHVCLQSVTIMRNIIANRVFLGKEAILLEEVAYKASAKKVFFGPVVAKSNHTWFQQAKVNENTDKIL